MKIESAILASCASGSAPDSTTFANGFILSDFEEVSSIDDEIESHVEALEEVRQEEKPEPENTVHEPSKPSAPTFFSRNKIMIVTLSVLLLLGLVLGAAWHYKWFSFVEHKAIDSTLDDKTEEDAKPISEKTNLNDLQLLQQFMETQPTTDTILAKSKEWLKTKNCEAMLRLLVHSGHKSDDARIALTYAKLYDPNLFQAGNCIDEADKDTAMYWYQKAVDSGNADAVDLLENLK